MLREGRHRYTDYPDNKGFSTQKEVLKREKIIDICRGRVSERREVQTSGGFLRYDVATMRDRFVFQLLHLSVEGVCLVPTFLLSGCLCCEALQCDCYFRNSHVQTYVLTLTLCSFSHAQYTCIYS